MDLINSTLINNETFLIQWISNDYTGGLDIDYYYINISTIPPSTSGNEIIKITNNNNNRYDSFVGKYNVTYEFTIIVSNSYLNSTLSKSTQPIRIFPPNPANSICSSRTITSINILVNKPNRVYYEPNADRYKIYYHETNNNNNNNVIDIDPIMKDAQFIVTIDKLQSGRNYSFNIMSGNIVAYSNISDSLTTICKTSVGPPPPPNITIVEQIDSNCMNITWILNDNNDNNIEYDTVIDYIITIRSQLIPDKIEINTNSPNTSYLYCPAYLKGAIMFEFIVNGRCDSGYTGDSNRYIFTTDPTRPDPVMKIYTLSETNKTINGEFEIPSDNGAAITKYIYIILKSLQEVLIYEY